MCGLHRCAAISKEQPRRLQPACELACWVGRERVNRYTTMLQNTAKIVSGFLGRGSWAVRAARPAYESVLDLIYKQNGMPWLINGSEFCIDPHHRHRLGHEYDPSVAEFFRTRLRSGQICFDIGANVGVYVLQFAKWLGPSGRVVAFEPNLGARRVLEHHVRI